MNDKLNLTILLSLGIAIRLISIFLFGDKIIVNEWADILINLENNGVFGLKRDENFISPNLFMPPLYPFFLFLLKKIYLFSVGYVEFVLFIQLIISIITIYCFIELSKIFFSNRLRIFSIISFIFFPLNIFSVSQISSISINVFLIVCFFLNFFLYLKKKKNKNILYFSILSGLLMLTRGEFILFYLFTLSYFFLIKKDIKKIIFSIFITILVLSPYLIRNYLVFEKVTITKSFGYNLWKGNNEFSKSEGYENIHDEKFKNQIENLEKNNNYDIEIDNLYKEKALNNLRNEPKKFFISFLKKLLSFFFLDFESTFPNYYNFFHILPKAILGILSFLGSVIALRKFDKFSFLSLFYLSYGFVFSFFFILPRYSLIVLPIQIILTFYFFNEFNFLRIKRKN